MEFTLLGLGTGAVIAGLSVALVITYRGSGVINFAQGAIAAFVAYTYYSLSTDGTVPLVPLPNPVAPVEALFGIEILDIPEFIGLGTPVPPALAIAVSLAIALLLGLLMHYGVFRPLRFAPPLARVVASVGVMLVLVGTIVIRFGSRPKPLEQILPNETVSLFGASMAADRFLIAAAVALITFVVAGVYRWTRFGLSARAAADDERQAILAGIDVDAVAGASWVTSTLVAGIVGILASPIVGLSPGRLTLFVIPALAAALLGRVSSVVFALVAGFGIGMAQSTLFALELRAGWVPDLNLPEVLPLVLIAIAMILRGETIPGRGAPARERLPDAYAPPITRARIGAYAFLVAATAGIAIFAPFPFRIGLNNTLIGVVLALSLVVVTGYVGQVSLMQMALAGVGAFGVATFSTEAGLNSPLAMALALLSAVAIGVLVAVPSVRTRGASLAIITLAAGVAIQQTLLEHDGWFGSAAPQSVVPPSIADATLGPGGSFPLGDGSAPSPAFGLLLLGLAVVSCFGVMYLRRSGLGLEMLAVRSNERAAAAAGINVSAVKIVGSAVAAGLAGLAGVMTAWKLGQLTSVSFGVFASLGVVAFAYLGGISTVGGAVMAGILFTEGLGVVVAEELLNLDAGRYTAYVAGLLLILTVVLHSEGLDSFQRKQFFRMLERLTNRSSAAAWSGASPRTRR